MTSNFRKLEAGSWILNLRHPTPGSPKLYSNFWELEVGLEGAISDHPPQYFFHAKKCVKTRKNDSFQGGKPPGRNARGNPWGPVRTRGGPRPLLGLFATGFVVVFARSKCLAVRSWKLKTNFRRSAVGSWICNSQLPTLRSWNLEVEIQVPEVGRWRPTSGRWKLAIGIQVRKV